MARANVFAAPGHPYTRCLQLANPAMSGSRRALYALPERMPGLRAYASIRGCAFAPRCPNVVVECGHRSPRLVEVERGHLAACIRADSTSAIEPPALARAEEQVESAPILVLSGLTKRFASRGLFRRSALTAVDNVNLTCAKRVRRHCRGKRQRQSTLARLIVGLGHRPRPHRHRGPRCRRSGFDAHAAATSDCVQDPQSA